MGVNKMYIRQLTEITDKALWKKVEKAKELFRIARKYKLSEYMIEEIAEHIETKEITDGHYSWKDNLKIWWLNVSWYQPMSELFILSKVGSVFSWENISCNQHLSEDFLEKYSFKLHWEFVCKYIPLSESLMNKVVDKLDWKNVCLRQKISEDFIIKNQDKINWSSLVMNHCVDMWFFERNKHLITVKLYASDLVKIIEKQVLSQETISEIKKGKMAWNAISSNCKLSKDFVLQNYKHIDANQVMRNYQMDKEVREEVEMIERLSKF
jgi:hypothetical protein